MVASLRFGDSAPKRKLPWQLTRGFDNVLRPGGTDIPADVTENRDLPYDLGTTAAQRAEIRAKSDANQPVLRTHGTPLHPFGAGLTNW